MQVTKNKILLDILGRKMPNMNCYDNNIIFNLSNYYKRDCSLSFLGGFDFTYRFLNQVDDLLDFNYVFTGDMLHVPVLLKQFSGIDTEIVNIDKAEKRNISDFVNDIINNLQNDKPIGFGIDSFHCPWNPYYMKVHRRHYILIIGINLETQELYCFDNFFSEEMQRLPIQTLFEYSDRAIYVKKVNVLKEVELKDIIRQLVLYLSDSGKSNSCEMIRTFADDIKHPRFIKNEKVKYIDLEKSNFMFRLSDIAWCRYNFAKSLANLSELFYPEQLKTIAEMAFTVYENWIKVKAVIAKGYMKNKVEEHLQRAALILYEIADREEEIMNLLKLHL